MADSSKRRKPISALRQRFSSLAGKQILITITQTKSYSIIFITVSIFFVGGVLVWSAKSRLDTFNSDQHILMRSIAVATSNEIEGTLEFDRHRVRLFLKEFEVSIGRLSANPNDKMLHEKLQAAIQMRFPYSFTFTIADELGKPMFEDFEGLVGRLCQKDIKAFSTKLHSSNMQFNEEIYIHPRSFHYHYDIMIPLSGGGLRRGVFFISFHAERLASILKNDQLPGYQLLLARQDDPSLIEVAAEGVRDKLNREIRLSAEEMERVAYTIAIPDTRWIVAVIPEARVANDFRRQVLEETGGVAIAVVLFGFVMLFIALRTERVLQESQAALGQKVMELDKSNQAKSEFLSRMSHELRTPLNAIMGFAQLLEHDVILSVDQKQKAKKINKAGRHLLDLIEEVLNFSKIEAGYIKLSMEAVDLEEIIDDCHELIHSLANERGVDLKINKNGCSVTVTADRTRLKETLLNLLSNAVKYNHKGGEVRMFCSESGQGWLRINVSDTGPGIAPEHHDELFEPFRRLDAENSGVEGTGIGLAITKKLVEMMGGTVGVESSLGKGSTFWIELLRQPATDTMAGKEKLGAKSYPENVEEREKSGVQLSQRILLAEDNLVNQEVAISALKLLGHKVVIAENGEEAVAKWEEGKYDLIIMDVQMPTMDGLEATKLIRKKEEGKGGHIPIIAMTARAIGGSQEECLAAGMDDYISKPIDFDKLREMVGGIAGTVKTDDSEKKAAELESTEPLYDLGDLRSLLRNDKSKIKRVLQKFIESTDQYIVNIEEAVRTGDDACVHLAAHSIKGSAVQINAVRLRELARELETMGSQKRLDGAMDTFILLKGEYDTIRVEIEKDI